MEKLSRKEIERLKKIELLRKLLQHIFVKHARLLLCLFVSSLVVILVGIYFFVTMSPVRYVASISLYYYPKNTKYISSFDAKYVLQLINRQTIRNRFYEETAEEGKRVPCVITISPEKKDKNGFNISTSSNSQHHAVAFANAFADLCIKSYIDERTESLLNWKKVLLQKKQDVFKDIQQVDIAKSRLGTMVLAPEKELDQLRAIMDEQHSAHTKLSLAIANLEHRQKRLNETISKINPAIFDFEKEIREQIETLKALDKEVLLARQLYTENNPKLMALVSRKKISENAFATFLKEKKLTVGDLDRLSDAGALKLELKTVSDELEARRAEMRALDIEVANINTRFHRLNEVLPHIQQLNQQHASLMESLQSIDTSIADISYLLPLIKDDLKIGIRATKAWGNEPFSSKNLAIGIFAALMLTGLFSTVLLLIEFLFGKVADESELKLFYEFRYLGALPVRNTRSEVEMRVVYNSVCHMLQSSYPEHHIVMVGTLPGGKIPSEMLDAFEWNYAMAGKRLLVLDMILASSFEDPGYNCDDMNIITYSGSKGYLPVTSKRLLAPTEIELLKIDLQTLRKSYDLIMIRHSASLRRDLLFIEQIATLCDGSVVAVGAGKTRRKSLRLLSAIHEKTKLPIMVILSDSSSLEDFVKSNHTEVKS